MALPKLDTPKYQLTLPSTGETIEYSQFTLSFIVDEELKNYKEIYDTY